MTAAEDDLTSDDALLGGRIRYRQPKRGYRVGVEAPLLAAFARIEGRRPPKLIADLGAGPGAVGLCLAIAEPRAKLVLVEIDPLHAALARENLAANGLADRSQVIEANVAKAEKILGRGSCDLVVSNPPWFDRGAGPSAEGSRREQARGLEGDELNAFLTTARQLLAKGGRLAMTFPSSSIAELFARLSQVGLSAKRMRMLHPRASAPANALFVDARAGRPGGLIVEPPFCLRGEGGAYTSEAAALLWPDRDASPG